MKRRKKSDKDETVSYPIDFIELIIEYLEYLKHKICRWCFHIIKDSQVIFRDFNGKHYHVRCYDKKCEQKKK